YRGEVEHLRDHRMKRASGRVDAGPDQQEAATPQRRDRGELLGLGGKQQVGPGRERLARGIEDLAPRAVGHRERSRRIAAHDDRVPVRQRGGNVVGMRDRRVGERANPVAVARLYRGSRLEVLVTAVDPQRERRRAREGRRLYGDTALDRADSVDAGGIAVEDRGELSAFADEDGSRRSGQCKLWTRVAGLAMSRRASDERAGDEVAEN